MAEENWEDKARADAMTMMGEFVGDIVEQAREGNIERYIDSNNSRMDDYHFQTHTPDLDLLEAATLLKQIRNHETDDGLWEGQEPEEAICTKAAFTYRQAVADAYRELMGSLKDEFESFDHDSDEERDHFAGWWIPAYVALLPLDAADMDGLVGTVWVDLMAGDGTGLGILADWAEDKGHHLAKDLRTWYEESRRGCAAEATDDAGDDPADQGAAGPAAPDAGGAEAAT